MTDSVLHTVLHEYPYPIAKCYERLVRTRNITERRDQVRYLFEVTLKYCACLAVAEYFRTGASDPFAEGALSCLSRPSMGHWVALLRQCLRHSSPTTMPGLSSALLDRTRTPGVVEGFNAIRGFVDPTRKSQQESVSILTFAEAMVTYRNRSTGHGAPQHEHVEKFTPLIEAAVVEMLVHLEVLKRFPLVYLSEIRVERRRFAHALTRLMGTSQVAMADYLTERDDALLGNDRSLLILDPDHGTPLLVLHPLVIYASDEVFILQHSDLRGSVGYLCHHTGNVYEADHTFEDFKERFGRFLGAEPDADGQIDAEAIYTNCLQVSLLDGHIAQEERAYLDDLARRLGISRLRTHELEQAVRPPQQHHITAPTPAATQTVPSFPAVSATENPSFSALVEQQSQLLRRLGQDVLQIISHQPDPSRAVRLDELVRGLGGPAGAGGPAISPQQLARLLIDVQNHGFAPGLVKTSGGYAVVEDHIAFKLTRDTALKEEIGHAAAALVESGMRLGLDGGSTTLPVAEALIVAIDSELLADLTIISNSVPIAQRFADFFERRGWSDGDCPVRFLLCAGRIRPVTKAIAEVTDAVTHTRDSLDALIGMVGGLDMSFVGANGITAAGGLTMPTDVELVTKRQFLTAASEPYIVADVSKLGLRHPVRIAFWDERLTLLTNRPSAPHAELDAILDLQRTVQIRFASSASRD
jgi:DeoR/GlpR family transcriptional regulator of sugar metabolism